MLNIYVELYFINPFTPPPNHNSYYGRFYPFHSW